MQEDCRKKIKVLQVVSCLEKGGTEAYIINNFKHIDRERMCFDFLVFVEKEYPYYSHVINQLGGRIFFCGLPSLKRMPAFLHAIIEVIKKQGPYQAVHAHVNIVNGWVLLAAKWAGVPIRISHSHDTSGKDSNNIIRKCYIQLEEFLIKTNATHYLACSRLAGAYLYGEDFFGANGNVYNNGIDVSQFADVPLVQREELEDALGIKNCITFGNITRLEAKKNTLFTIEVFSEIVKKHQNAVLLLGGPDGGLLGEAKRRVHELGIEDKVRFIGTREDVPVILQLIDIYLFPSLFEGLGIAVLEAQAAGVYTIASEAVSKESDMGLGLIEFCPLDIERWTKAVCSHLQRERVEKERIIKQFQKNGYLIQDSAKKLAELYEGKAGNA